MKVQSLGHVVLKVRSLEQSVPFYRDVLGLKEVARYRDVMAFFSAGDNHHDIGLMEVGDAAAPNPHSVGLYHVALKVGNSRDELRAFKAHLEHHGIAILGMADHRVSQSLYITDPDGIEIEIYVDADPEIWRNDPAAVATVRPLTLWSATAALQTNCAIIW
ncbi:MAG: VOC family protein [Burkholderiales bacterium]|nr:VOC family protein [Burkholderiales bacterium]